MERVGIMAVARGARKTANTSFVISIRRTRTVTWMDDLKPCPYYQGVCGLDESYLCYRAGYPNSCEIYKKHEEDKKDGDGNERGRSEDAETCS